jgi:ribosomal protein S25
MRKYIQADAELNFPTPTTAMVAMQVDAMHRAGVVTASVLAQHYKVSEPVIKYILRRAENIRLLRNDPKLGWLPVQS